MSRAFLVLTITLFLPNTALAFCGGWNSAVAPGFDGGSWGEKWVVLAAILAFVGFWSTLVVRQVRVNRNNPALEA